MLRPQVMNGWGIALALAVGLGGCGSPASQEQPKSRARTESRAQEKPTAGNDAAGHTGHEGHNHSAGEGKQADHIATAKSNGKSGAVPPEVAKALSQLSESDRAAAEKQRVCPVTGALLGSMDKPHKVTVKGAVVFLCCDSCEPAIVKDPDKYLAKLKADASK